MVNAVNLLDEVFDIFRHVLQLVLGEFIATENRVDDRPLGSAEFDDVRVFSILGYVLDLLYFVPEIAYRSFEVLQV